jgi:hypothetical protein
MEPQLNDIVKRKEYPGTYACELEIEFDSELAEADNYKIGSASWQQVKDGSLRNGFELIMRGPVPYKKLFEVIEQPAQMLAAKETGLDDTTLFDAIKWSNRCSVHVHMNVQTFTPRQLLLFSTLWYVFEPIIVEKFAPERVGNLFCLRAVDAPVFVDHVIESFKPETIKYIDGNRRYMGLNWASIGKFCSLEFRYLRGSIDAAYIVEFISYVEALRNWVLTCEADPKDVLPMLSMRGLAEMFEECFDKPSQGIDFNAPVVWQSLRLAQDLCYGVDLTAFKPVKKFNDDRMEHVFYVAEHEADEGEL